MRWAASATLQVILPEPLQKSYPVLYLLHGLVDDQTKSGRARPPSSATCSRWGWRLSCRRCSAAGTRIWHRVRHTFVADELPALVKGMFPISSRRKDTFVAGLSMGGYGAFKLALAHPERYAAAASLSGALMR
ncbi:MAG: alpha/beta hydrolase-fold protein [Caldilineales bacterium]